uniref:Uncharacterized protein n=1 Tax=Steinernema glaseri TaxID=37863 RepID=A0A1I7XVM5_9BILA
MFENTTLIRPTSGHLPDPVVWQQWLYHLDGPPRAGRHLVRRSEVVSRRKMPAMALRTGATGGQWCLVSVGIQREEMPDQLLSGDREYPSEARDEDMHGTSVTWGSNEKRCPISSCQVTGSIQVKPEMRTCTEPA